MSNSKRVQNIFIGDGTASPAAGSLISSANIVPGVVAVANTQMNTMTPGDTVANSEAIFIVEGRTSTSMPVKRSMKIPGRRVTSFLGTSYKPAARDVWAIGFNRKTASGSIAVSNDADYQFYIRFKNPKFLFSERILRQSFSIHSAVVATQLSIANQITVAINANLASQPNVVAVTVGDGTGAYGLTGATNYGVEVTGLLIAIDTNNYGSYLEERVYFDIELDDFNSAFAATTIAHIGFMTHGSGTYNQTFLLEKFNLGYEGVLNFTRWPIPAQVVSATSALFSSSNVTGVTGNVTATINLDQVTVATSTAILRAGEFIDINGTQYEIKYLADDGVTLYLTSVATATYAGANLKVKYKYDSIVIEFTNPNTLEAVGVTQTNLQSVAINVPSIDAAAAYNSQSAQLLDILGVLNPYMQSLGFATLNL